MRVISRRSRKSERERSVSVQGDAQIDSNQQGQEAQAQGCQQGKPKRSRVVGIHEAPHPCRFQLTREDPGLFHLWWTRAIERPCGPRQRKVHSTGGSDALGLRGLELHEQVAVSAPIPERLLQLVQSRLRRCRGLSLPSEFLNERDLIGDPLFEVVDIVREPSQFVRLMK